MVRQEADGLLVDNDARARYQLRALARRDRIARAFEEASRERREDLGAYAHAAEVALVLGAVAHARAHEIAEVVCGEPGHRGVEVDDGERLAALGVEQHVRDLGVVVDRALSENTPAAGAASAVASGRRSKSASISARHEAARPWGSAALTPSSARTRAFGVVKAGDRRVERGRGQVRQSAQEQPEGARGGKGVRSTRGALRPAGALDPRQQAPGLAALVQVRGGALARRAQARNAALRVLGFPRARAGPGCGP